MCALNKIIGRGNSVYQLRMGDDCDQEFDKDDEDYTSPLMDLIRSYF